jgi:DNA-binding protein HU-beta
MNKKDLVENLSDKTTLTKAQIRQVVDETFDYITQLLADGGKFQVLGFGTFQAKKRAGRIGVNPKTGEKIRIEEKIVPVFSPGKKLLQAVNNDKKE